MCDNYFKKGDYMMKMLISAMLGCLVGVGGTYLTLVGSPNNPVEFVILVILCIAGFFLISTPSKKISLKVMCVTFVALNTSVNTKLSKIIRL